MTDARASSAAARVRKFVLRAAVRQQPTVADAQADIARCPRPVIVTQRDWRSGG
jgi:hypothetical protein